MKVIGHGICLLVIANTAHAFWSSGPSCPEGNAPDQGTWGTCSLYGIMGAVRSFMQDAYGVELNSVNNLVENLVSHNFGCDKVEQICDSGACTPNVIKELTRRMLAMRNKGSSEALQLMGKVPGHPKALLTFQIRSDEYTSTKSLSKKKMLYSVIVGSRVKQGGGHGRHAMQGLMIDGDAVVTCNSWGRIDKNIKVGAKDAKYPKLEKILVIDVYDVKYRTGMGNDWQTLKRKTHFKSEL